MINYYLFPPVAFIQNLGPFYYQNLLFISSLFEVLAALPQ